MQMQSLFTLREVAPWMKAMEPQCVLQKVPLLLISLGVFVALPSCSIFASSSHISFDSCLSFIRFTSILIIDSGAIRITVCGEDFKEGNTLVTVGGTSCDDPKPEPKPPEPSKQTCVNVCMSVAAAARCFHHPLQSAESIPIAISIPSFAISVSFPRVLVLTSC